MSDIEYTQVLRPGGEGHERPGADEVLSKVYAALLEKGYDPINQIVGYIMSGDPTYITGHNNARSLIMKCERDELLEELVESYVANKLS